MDATLNPQRVGASFCRVLARPSDKAAFPDGIRKLLPLVACLPGLLFASVCHGEFAMNFSGPTSTTIVHGNSGISGQTPFTPMGNNQATGESVIDPLNGLRYWHYILGDPATGFAQEIYIRGTGSSCGQFSICSASGGTVGFGGNNVLGSNAATTSGNGTGNPTAVIMRQILGGTWVASTSAWTCDTAYCSEFIKAAYADKPKITQGMNSPDFTAMFILDMSSIALSDNSTALTVTNQATGATGASLTSVQAMTDTLTGNVISFDMADDSQLTYVNGGRYTYTSGPGVLGARGTYVYVDGGYDPQAVDYSPYLDHSVSNPWAYPDTQP